VLVFTPVPHLNDSSEPELIPISVAFSEEALLHLDGMMVHRRLPPQLLLVPIILMGREKQVGLSVLQCDLSRFKPGTFRSKVNFLSYVGFISIPDHSITNTTEQKNHLYVINISIPTSLSLSASLSNHRYHLYHNLHQHIITNIIA
jgi:hypothetical protein